MPTAVIGGMMDFCNDNSYDLPGRLTKFEQKQQTGNAVAAKRADFEYSAASQFTTIGHSSDLARHVSDRIGCLSLRRHGAHDESRASSILK